MAFCVCVSVNEDFKIGEVLKLLKHDSSEYNKLEREDGSIVFYSKWKFERDFNYIDIFWIPTYCKASRIFYYIDKMKFWNKEDFEDYYYNIGGKCYYRNKEYYVGEFNPKKFKKNREQYDLLVRALWKLAKVRDFNENLIFQVSGTLVASLDALVVYFEKAEDSVLTEEVLRFHSLVDELVTLNEDVESNVTGEIEEQWNNALQQSVNQHKEMLSLTIDTLKKINATK